MEIQVIIKSKNATLIDVRSVEEFESGSAPDAINIPLHTIPDHLTEIKEMKSPVVVFCRSGARSGQAAAWLKQHGVEVFNGGALNSVLDVLEV